MKTRWNSAATEALMGLLRLALGTEGDGQCSNWADGLTSYEAWKEVFDLAFSQKVAGILADGIERMDGSTAAAQWLESDEGIPARDWLQGAVIDCEKRNRKLTRVLHHLASLYATQGIEMMVLKGYGLSLDYPTPTHRAAGDIDIYLYGKGQEGDRWIEEQMGIKAKQDEEKHSIFTLRGISVENHATLITTSEHRSRKPMERRLEQLAHEATCLNGMRIPTAQFNALFLPLHMGRHFVYGGMSLKQLTDWAVFTLVHGSEVDWNEVMALADEGGYRPFLHCINQLVVEHYGVPADRVPPVQSRDNRADRMWQDISQNNKGKQLINCLFKKQRLVGTRHLVTGRWRYRMVYNDCYAWNLIEHSTYLFKGRYLKGTGNVWEKK